MSDVLKHSASTKRGCTVTDTGPDRDRSRSRPWSSPRISGHGHPAHGNLSVKIYNDGDHDATSRVSLLVDSQLEYRDTTSYKMARE